jgi:LysM repeat protein
VRLGPKNPSVWKALLGSLLGAMVPAVTVLGAVLLSLLGQLGEEQPAVKEAESDAVQTIPTAAMATPLLNAFDPTPSAVVDSAAGAETEFALEAEDTTPISACSGAACSGAGEDATSTGTSGGVTPPLGALATSTQVDTPWPCDRRRPSHWDLYPVQRGDTLFSLAAHHNVTIDEVVKYNCLTGYDLWVGQQLYLPALVSATPTAILTPTLSLSPTWTALPPTVPPPSDTPVPVPAASPTASATPRPTPGPGTTLVPTLTPSEPAATETYAPTETPAEAPTSTSRAAPLPSLTAAVTVNP